MFFITEGKAALHLDASDPTKTTPPPVIELSAGTMLGEMSLLNDVPSMGHVVALDVSEAFYLSCEAFDAIVEKHEDFAEKIRTVMTQRQAANEARKVRDASAVPGSGGSGETAGSGVAAVGLLYRTMTNTSIATSRMRVHPDEPAQAMSSDGMGTKGLDDNAHLA